MTPLALTDRAGLPEALRVLVTELPREAWEAHPDFGGTVQFWMERHMMFRDLLGRLQSETEAALDRATAPEVFAHSLSRLGGVFLENLHGHHQIEDNHYFPQLITLDARLERGFEILDADHHVLHARLDRFAEAANDVLKGGEAGGLHTELTGLKRLLDRHLCDEEEIVVPVILKSGFRG